MPIPPNSMIWSDSRSFISHCYVPSMNKAQYAVDLNIIFKILRPYSC